MTKDEIIKKLKDVRCVQAFDLCSGEEQAVYREAGPENCMELLRERGVWVAVTEGFINPGATYRLDSHWQPAKTEPEYESREGAANHRREFEVASKQGKDVSADSVRKGQSMSDKLFCQHVSCTNLPTTERTCGDGRVLYLCERCGAFWDLAQDSVEIEVSVAFGKVYCDDPRVEIINHDSHWQPANPGPEYESREVVLENGFCSVRVPGFEVNYYISNAAAREDFAGYYYIGSGIEAFVLPSDVPTAMAEGKKVFGRFRKAAHNV